MGMFMQSIMLLAREHGLHTCPQESWSGWYREVGAAPSLPAHRMLFAGIAVGYRDESAPINRLRTEPRAADGIRDLPRLRLSPQT